MPSDHPPSPQSPNQQPFETADYNHKLSTSPNISNSLLTPAHSINGSMSSTGDLPAFADPTNMEEMSHKRKREEGDFGDREQKKVHIEDSMPSIGDLHMDVGPGYKLCHTPHPAPPIPYAEDLFQRFGLTEIAKSVARTTPDGTKVNIRKSYKGYITKTFKLSGSFDSVKQENKADTLLELLREVPEETFSTARKEIGHGLTPLAIQTLPRAMTMAKGLIPRDAWNDKVLGITDSSKLVASTDQAKLAQAGSRTPSQVVGVQRVSKGEIRRPARNIKKRTYGDTSYEGYGEGYVDDDQDTGYSTGGDPDDRAGGRKRPKKFGNTQASLPRQTGYGPGNIGV